MSNAMVKWKVTPATSAPSRVCWRRVSTRDGWNLQGRRITRTAAASP